MGAAEDKFKILEEKVKAATDLDGTLVIKISQRQTPLPGMNMAAIVPRLICTLGNASVAHLMNPELWVPRLMGGGRFVLQAYAPGSMTASLVDLEVDLAAESRAVPDWDAIDETAWGGPRSLMYPAKGQRGGNSTTVLPLSIVSPPSPSPGVPAPQTQSLGSVGGLGAAHQEEMRRMQEHHAAQIAAMHAQTQALSQRLADEQHKREMEAIQATHKQELEKFRRETQESLQKIAATSAQPPAKQTSIGDTLKEIAPLVTTLFTGWMAMRAESEKQSAERERRAEERQTELLKTLSAPRPVIDPVVKELLESQRANELPVSAILQQSAQATAAVMATMSDMMIKFAEANQGPEENPLIKVAREVGAAIQGIVKASAGAPKAPRRLPPQQQVAQGPIVTPPPQASPVPESVPAMGELPPRPVPLDTLKKMLEAHEDPVRAAKFVVASASTPEFQAAFQAAGNEAFQMFENLMGKEWLESNAEYVVAFGNELKKYETQAPDEGEDPEADDDEG